MDDMILEIRLEEQLERQQRIREQIEKLSSLIKIDSQETSENNK
ncbi:hypothetical protein [Paenibacillus sp. GP183]|nr:hypothetical protein [Paenibacillus sp. GP183]SEB53914.1 hypothetical protein SAMN05443246_0958 [Paenibacillus sp. GP183]